MKRNIVYKTPKDMPYHTESVVKGDATSMSIAAASIPEAEIIGIAAVSEHLPIPEIS